MWDKPEALSAISNLLLMLVAAMTLYAAMEWAGRLPGLSLKALKVEGMTRHLARDQVDFIAGRRMRGNFFTVDIDGVRRDFEKLPWVRNVSVRRRWPFEIDVKIEEHVPLARWGANQLVDTYGDVFDASTDRNLPYFSGPPGSSSDVAREYTVFSKSLAPLNRRIAQVRLSARRAWEVRLDDGMVIELGRDKMDRRLSEFATLYDRTVGQMKARIEYVDLRYENGFAVRVPGTKSRLGGAA